MTLTEHQKDLLASTCLLAVPSALLLIISVRWMCRPRPVPNVSSSKRRSRRPRCPSTKPVLLLVKEPRQPHQVLFLLLIGVLFRVFWFVLYLLDVAPSSQCLSGLNCYPQVLVTLVNRISQLAWFVAAARMLPLLGFAANARSWMYEPGGGDDADLDLKAHVESLPVFGGDLSLKLSNLALDLWLIVLQVVTLIVTIFVDIPYEHSEPVYLAYQLQVVTLYTLLGLIYAFGGWQHRKDLGKLCYKLLDRATCRVVLGREGCLYAIFSLVCPDRASAVSAVPEGYSIPDMSRESSRGAHLLVADAALMGPRLTSAEAESAAYFRSFREEDEDKAAAEEAEEERKKKAALASAANPSMPNAVPSAAPFDHEDSGSGTDDEARSRSRSRSRALTRPRMASSPPPPPPRPLSFPNNGSSRGLSRSRGESLLGPGNGKASRSNTAGTEDSLSMLLSGHDHSGPYAVYALCCLLVAALLLIKAALFSYTPFTEGGQIKGVASQVLWPWFFYVAPEGIPPLIFLHLILRGGLFSCAGWKCKPSCKPRKGSNNTRSSAFGAAAAAGKDQKPVAAAVTASVPASSSVNSALTTTPSIASVGSGYGTTFPQPQAQQRNPPVRVSFTPATGGGNSNRPSLMAPAAAPAVPANAGLPLPTSPPSSGAQQPLLVQVGGKTLVIMGGAAPGTAAVVTSGSSSSSGSVLASPRPSLQPPL